MRIVSALVISAGLSGPADAHPHIFVDATTGFRIDDGGRLTALRISWTYDAFTSLVIFDRLALDPDGDGRLDDADRAAIVAGETDWPPGYEGDVYLDVNGAPVAMGRPENAEAWLEKDRVSVAFDLPLSAPLAAPMGVRLRLYDPAYYYAYTIIAVDRDVPERCTIDVDRFEADAATADILAELAALSRGEIAAQEDVGALFAGEVNLTCG